MGRWTTSRGGKRAARRLLLATALATLFGAAEAPAPAYAQTTGLPGGLGSKEVPPGTPLLLEADRLIYNRDADTVTASGAVQVAYGEYRIVAESITYDQRSGRLIARGAVEIVEPDGNRIYADEIDVTDDFADGFVNALRVETTARTRFAAQSAVRGDAGQRTVFNNGVYTACNECTTKDGDVAWRVRARTVVWNQEERTIEFQRPSFELFGQPLVELPGFTIPDHTVERKSGFLFPRARYADELGAGLTIPYYLALNPSYDATLEATVFSRQGLLAEAQFRRRFRSGDLELRVAGIAQLDPDAFDPGTTDDTVGRAMIGGRGDFRINERWQWGFDFIAQTDDTFAATYDIAGYDAGTFVNNVYLIGLDDRAYFEIKAEEFVVQSNDLSFKNENPIVYPSLDYEKTLDTPVAGGEVSLAFNALNLTRERQACRTSRPAPGTALGFVEETDCAFNPTTVDPNRLANRVTGIDGNYTRLTGELEWSGAYTMPVGLVLEPVLALRADAFAIDIDNASAGGQTVGFSELHGTRTMATAGIEARYPVQVTTLGGIHIFEPVAQLFVRPDENIDGAVVNEDSQSLVFDATNLFERDKFSGYDRTEGGTRANLGLRYAGSLDNGVGIDALIGQSFHIAGTNPYARASQAADLTNVGAQSGLETDRSDYVGALSFSLPNGLSSSLRGRLDESTLALRRGEIEAAYVGLDFSAVAKYAYIDPQPDVERIAPRHQLQGAAELALGEGWSITANATYDLERGSLYQRGIGLHYDCDCLAVGVEYSENRRNLDAIQRSVQFNVSLRTIGDLGVRRATAANN